MQALREALERCSSTLNQGSPARTRQLQALVDCLLLTYKSREENVVSAASSPLLSCPGCGNLLLDPVTAQCGHTYCRHCLKGEPRSRCRLCRGDMGRLPRRTCVLLKNVTDKWFPQVARFSWQDRCISELLEAQEYREVIRKSQEALQEEPYDVTLHVYMAEAYSGLYEYDRALEELNFVLLNQPDWPEVYSKKANVLQKMGHLYESLQFYLHCLALDEEFGPAREEIEKLLCDLLSPVPENVKESLKDPVWNSPASSPLKPFVLGSDEEPAHNRCVDENKDMPKAKDLSSSCLHRVQSIQLIYSPEEPAASESLKRVASEPLLSRKEKGIFLKRKFSFSEQDSSVCEDERKKHVKQEETSEPGKYLIASRNIPEGHVDLADFECSLCMRLFYEPVTTPCGHTFCKKCLERCLDHTPQCPLCKESLTEYLATRNYNVTHMLEDLIKRYLPEALSDRKIIHEEETAEISNLTMNVPVFVCTMAYPTVPCPLHVFEPRYRLMIRRCMETGTKKFGMCISDPEKSFADHGCMLQIRNVHFLPDGRSVVDTVGGKRFRVLKRGMKDGYWTADIEYLSDIQVEDAKLQELKDLHDAVYMQACRWFQNLRYRFRSQILHHFGAMPETEENIQAVPNGPAWCWWLLAVLPVDRRYQLSVLSVTSLKDRLLKLQHILTCFSRNQSK